MVKVLHFSDLHLGVENYGRLDPETGLNSRLERAGPIPRTKGNSLGVFVA